MHIPRTVPIRTIQNKTEMGDSSQYETFYVLLDRQQSSVTIDIIFIIQGI